MTPVPVAATLPCVIRLRPTAAQRLWAVAALILTVGAVVLAILAMIAHFPLALGVIACLAAALLAVWEGVRRRGAGRMIALALAAALLAGSVVLAVSARAFLEDMIILGIVLVGLAGTRRALRLHAELPAAPAPRRAVLFYNPRSGGGKAQRFGLPEEARRRGITPIELTPGEDLETLVRDAVQRGADALAMAGGDGSQAIVAMVAAETQLPYACIPAGTRNHFALDLGVDRDDVVGALDAFVSGGEKRVDLADVNGRVFVNNVSLGLYAEAVQRPEYRDAKLQTLLDAAPDALGPGAPAPRLSWEGARGPESAAALLVSNDPYRLGRVLASGTRPRLDRGILGLTALVPIAPAAPRRRARPLRMRQWTARGFEIQSAESVAAGVDGEALRFTPPLRFTAHPRALRVRIAPQHPGASPSAALPATPAGVIAVLATLALRGRLEEGTRGRAVHKRTSSSTPGRI